MIDLRPIQDRARASQIGRRRAHGDQEECIICGRPVNPKRARRINIHGGGGTAIKNSEQAEADAKWGRGAALDLLVVGPECAKLPDLAGYVQ